MNGGVVLDAPVSLPNGTEVEIATVVGEVSAPISRPTWAEVFRDVIGQAEGLPEDFSTNHDHYIHGSPKR
jgi:hypothetical protein